MSISKFFHKSKHTIISVILFHLIFAVIAFQNLHLNQYFIGWDALSPELNISANLQRAVFAGWQENYGMGTLGGHGFAATLPHVLIIWILSFALPQEMIRNVFTLLCLYLGGLGMMYFSKKITHLLNGRFSELKSDLYSSYIILIPSLFYLFNLATTQIFYIQLEAFIIHFACLPWLFGLLLSLLEKMKLRTLLLFFFFNFLGSVQGFIPSLFVAYSLSVTCVLFFYLAAQRFSMESIKKALLIVFIIAGTNLYWFLPFGYYTTAKGSNFLNAYNNLLSTPQFIADNQKYGDLNNVLLLKSFFLEGYQLNSYVFEPWLGHISNPTYLASSYLFIGFLIVGIASTLLYFRKKMVLPFLAILIYFFGSMGTQIFPFSALNSFLASVSATYEQAFRTTFSKFGIGLGFSYAIFIFIGVLSIAHLILTFKQKHKLYFGYVGFLFILLLYLGFPHFLGKTLYSKLFVTIPKQYQEMMSYFKTQGNGRIAQFPQDCAEGWYSYDWGYFGSGFLWYGVKQPFAERSFDVWSKANENYYWEVTEALRQNDFTAFQAVLQKYQIKWLVYDPHLLNCRTKEGFNYQLATLNQIETSTQFKKVQVFSEGTQLPITIYENTSLNEKNFLSSITDPPNVQTRSEYQSVDPAFKKYGNYISDDQKEYSLVAPFSSLFSKREGLDKSISIHEEANSLTFTTSLEGNYEGYSISKNQPLKEETTLPAKLVITPDSAKKQNLVSLEIILPQIRVNNRLQFIKPTLIPLGSFPISNEATSIILNSKIEVNVDEPFLIDAQKSQKIQLVNKEYVALVSYSLAEGEIASKSEALPSITLENGKNDISVSIPKVKITALSDLPKDAQRPSNCGSGDEISQGKYEVTTGASNNFVRLIDKQSSQCLGFGAYTYNNLSGALLKTQSRHITGGKLKLTTDITSTFQDSQSYLSGENESDFNTHYFVISKVPENKILSISLKNTSYNQNETINDISLNQEVYYLPFSYLTQVEVVKPNQALSYRYTNPVNFSSEHPNETFYSVRGEARDKVTYLTLNQSYDSHWIAVNTASGFSILPHQMYNGWANSWLLPEGEYQVSILYLPQILVYIGYGILVISALGLVIFQVWFYLRSRNNS